MLDFPEWLAVEKAKSENEKLLHAAELRVIRAADMYEWAVEQGDTRWITQYTLQLDREDAEAMRLFALVEAERAAAAYNAQSLALAHAA